MISQDLQEDQALLLASPVPGIYFLTQWYFPAPCSKHLSPKSLCSPQAGLLQAPATPCELRGPAKKVVASYFPPNQGLMTPWAVPTTSAARTLGSHTLRGKAHGLRCAQGVLCKGSREQVYRSGCGALGSSF